MLLVVAVRAIASLVAIVIVHHLISYEAGLLVLQVIIIFEEVVSSPAGVRHAVSEAMVERGRLLSHWVNDTKALVLSIALA